MSRRGHLSFIAMAGIALALLAGPAGAIVGTSSDGGALSASMLMVLSRTGSIAGFCSGIVVAQDAILTAAHCVPAGAALKGHYRDASAPVLLEVIAVVRNPLYRADAIKTRQRSIDLALVRLAHPLPPAFRPATLGDTDQTTPDAPFRLAGFGLQREGEPASGGKLRIAAIAARTPLSEVLLWSHDPTGRGNGACTGDSGGAALDPVDDRVVGVIAWSAGSGAARCGMLTQAVWIAPQRAWIASVLAGWAAAR